MKKGIILGNALVPLDNSTVGIDSPQPSEIRKYLLYWDKIEIPEIDSGFRLGSGIIDELKSLDEVSCTTVSLPRLPNILSFQDIGDNEIRAQVEAYKLRSKETDTLWSIAQNSHVPLGLEHDKKERAIELELYKCLPVPTEDTPFHDILDFKAKRQDELAELNFYLEEIIEKVVSSENINRSLKIHSAKLKKSIVDMETVLNERKIKFDWRSIKTFVECIQNPAMAAAGLGTSLMFPHSQTLGLMGVASIVSLAVRDTVKVGTSQGVRPMTYLASLPRDGIKTSNS